MKCHRCGSEVSTSKTAICVCRGMWRSQSSETVATADESLTEWPIGLCGSCLTELAQGERREASNELLGGMALLPLVGTVPWLIETGSDVRGWEKMIFGLMLVVPPIVGPLLAISYIRRRARWRKPPTAKEVEHAFESEARRTLEEVQAKKRADFDLPKPGSFDDYDSEVKAHLAAFTRTGEQYTVHISSDDVAKLRDTLSKQNAERLQVILERRIAT